MTRCPFAIFKNNYSGGNRGVANVVSVVATFPARLRIQRVVCGLCVLFFYNFMPPNLNASFFFSFPPIAIRFIIV